MIPVSLLDVLSLPIITTNGLSAYWRTAAAWLFQHPVRNCCEERVVDGHLLTSSNSPARLKSHFVAHPQIGITGMIHATNQLFWCWVYLDHVGIFPDLYGIVPVKVRNIGLKFCIRKHRPTNDHDRFALLDCLSGNHPVPLNRRRPNF